MEKKFLLILFLGIIAPVFLGAQSTKAEEEEAFFVKKIYDEALTHSQAYPWLNHLCRRIGGRLSGTPQAAAAVEYTRQMLDTLGLDSVWLQPVMVPHWDRGEPEQVRIVNSRQVGSIDLKALSLGNSIGTGPQGLTAPVVEVKSLDDVDRLGESLAGKIVFYNRPLDPTQLNTFSAYGGAVDQRGAGAARAAKYGAVGVLVRSMTTRNDDVPHTGGTSYSPDAPPIPALAISTNDANLLSRVLQNETVEVFIRNTSRMLAEELSYNVIGEIRGSTKPGEIIVVGGHLDSWDVGQGAHDDGAGCVQSMEVLRSLKALNYRPQRTIRCVLFMNEENGLRGGRAYAQNAAAQKEKHLAAIESDRGGFTPRGFSADGDPATFEKRYRKVTQWLPLLEPYGLSFSIGGGGADISPLKPQGTMLFGFIPDSQRYFDYHHTAIDTIEAVNERELNLGAATMTALVYLLDKYGL
ncbi:MAG: M20/M25/M40 family metallo-hydrolase [Lewinellaceae bacterium]|nr:M20/M25/M40 family metallo-hydrolase [Lewinellaceae bacterium]